MVLGGEFRTMIFSLDTFLADSAPETVQMAHRVVSSNKQPFMA